MANPRFVNHNGSPTVELLGKLARAKDIYLGNLGSFCDKWYIKPEPLRNVERVFLIGSHATEKDWHNETSDLDFKFIIPEAMPMDLFRYKRDILDPVLCPRDLEKHRWIDLFFVRELYQVLNPRIDLTDYWKEL